MTPAVASKGTIENNEARRMWLPDGQIQWKFTLSVNVSARTLLLNSVIFE
jgi:hypothetical protein